MSDAADLSELLAIARQAAVLAGEVIMPLYRDGTTVEFKADHTPVTEADRRAEVRLREFLLGECPDFGVLGEEFGEDKGDGRHRWIIDPIDGTKSFVHHVPLFGTLVALERDGVPVIGVIACHAVGETIYAARGLGAFLNGEPIRVSSTASLAEATVSTTTIVGLADAHPEFFARLCREVRLFRAWGDCYGYLLVATGRIDVMLDPVMSIWDVAALAPVITEAGGRLTQWSGDATLGNSAIATNGALHNAILALVGGHG